jgi:hypothetical protein
MAMSTNCGTCGRSLVIGAWPFCPHATDGRGDTLLRAIHPSERAVVYRNPRTGEVRYPARNDQPVPPVYARQGFVRDELRSVSDVRRFEKETGRLHERSHYDPGSGRADRELTAHCGDPPIKGLDGPTPFVP